MALHHIMDTEKIVKILVNKLFKPRYSSFKYLRKMIRDKNPIIIPNIWPTIAVLKFFIELRSRDTTNHPKQHFFEIHKVYIQFGFCRIQSG